jgi:tetratricopeptide (TPR) repeat protein
MHGRDVFIELQEFHRRIATDCFNQCWTYIEKEKRTDSEDEEMRRLAEVSFWHWMHVEDHTNANESVGYWQLARVYAISGRYKLTYYYADQCIEISKEGSLDPFYLGYGYEARARAYLLGGRAEEGKEAFKKAYELAEQVSDPEWKDPLAADLDQVQGMIAG